MQTIKRLLSIILLTVAINAQAKELNSSDFKRGTPPRVIRTCCAFGNEVGYVAVPYLKHSDIVSGDEIGPHSYLGGRNEGNGIVYTYRGGFIDLGHLRDQADWTAYLNSLIKENRGNGDFEIVLGHEAGRKTLQLNIPKDFSDQDAAFLAGRIAYDLSVWHEIATWYGASTVPLVPERYSSFSAEDDYSNQLGATLGIQAVLSEKPYNEAMTELLKNKLDTLHMVKTYEESCKAMELVEGEWWSKYYRFPNKRFLLTHEVAKYDTTYPLLVPELTNDDTCPIPVTISLENSKNVRFENFYTLKFNLNGKLPYKKLFSQRKSKKQITNSDFATLLMHIKNETKLIRYGKLYRKQKRKSQNKEL